MKLSLSIAIVLYVFGIIIIGIYKIIKKQLEEKEKFNNLFKR